MRPMAPVPGARVATLAGTVQIERRFSTVPDMERDITRYLPPGRAVRGTVHAKERRAGNNGMELEVYVPSAPLAEYVQMLWYWEGYHPPHPRERILPGGMMEITINLSDTPFRLDDGQIRLIDGPMAAGAQSQPFVIDTIQPMSILSVWFKPGGAVPFFDTPGCELHNRHVPLEMLWGRQARNLYDHLREAPCSAVRFRILEQALLARLHRTPKRHRAVGYALQLFCTMPHALKIGAVVDTLALSPTRFIQLFREDVGMTPKQFCRVQRFQRALRLMTDRQVVSWGDVALACGYYDQAHFVNEFRRLAGITPTAYAPQSREHNTNLPVYELS